MNIPPPPAVDDESGQGILGRSLSFLSRSARGLRWQKKNLPEPGAGSEPPHEEPQPQVASEVDPHRIESLHFRREVLDWRDEFHFRVTETAERAAKAMEEQVGHELSNMSVLRLRLFPKPASEVLDAHIASCVRSPLSATTRALQDDLRQRVTAWLPRRQEAPSIWIFWPRLEWQTRLALDFTADNRERILQSLGDLILGEGGLAGVHRQWATHYASQILEMRRAHCDSV